MKIKVWPLQVTPRLVNSDLNKRNYVQHLQIWLEDLTVTVAPERVRYNCSAVVIAVAARLKWGRCARNFRYGNKVYLPSENPTRVGRGLDQ